MSSASDVTPGAALSRHELARRVAQDIPDGYWVNLGIGMPTLVAEVDIGDREVVFHCENGMVGMGPQARDEEVDPDLINAGKDAVTLLPGGSFMNQAESFAIVRGRHLDLAVLGAYQIGVNGDLANWAAPGEMAPAVGGAMDLAVGARQVWVMTTMLTRTGQPKLVDRCTFPLTAARVVRRIFTDVCVLTLEDGVAIVDEILPGLRLADVQELTPVRLVQRAA